MNKIKITFAAAITLGILAGNTRAENEYVDDQTSTWKWSPVGIGIAAPLQLPWMSSSVYGLRFGGFFGSNAAMYGYDIGIAERTTLDFRGLQTGAFGWTEGNAYGMRVNALATVTDGNAWGLDVGFANVVWGAFTGVQLGAITYDSSFCGLQIAGLLNWVSETSSGMQVAFANADQDSFTGCQIGGLNKSDNFLGCAIGVVNIADTARGFQLGLINACDNMSGLQLGLVNLITTSRLPIMVIANGNF